MVDNSQKGNIEENPDILLKLKPSRIMQRSGDVFKSEYLAIDTVTGLVYRKEHEYYVAAEPPVRRGESHLVINYCIMF